MAQIYAAIHYAAAAYGGAAMANVIGHGHGYAKGGLIAEPISGVGHLTGDLYSFGEKGPETVTPGLSGGGSVSELATKLDRIAALVGRLIDTTAAVPAGVGHHVGGQLGNAAQAASFRNRYPQGGW